MSVMDRIKSMLKGHPEQSQKGGDRTDDKSQGRYQGQGDTGRDKNEDEFGGDQGQNPSQG